MCVGSIEWSRTVGLYRPVTVASMGISQVQARACAESEANDCFIS